MHDSNIRSIQGVGKDADLNPALGHLAKGLYAGGSGNKIRRDQSHISSRHTDDFSKLMGQQTLCFGFAKAFGGIIADHPDIRPFQCQAAFQQFTNEIRLAYGVYIG